MSIIDRARDALDKANKGPWYTNSRQSRTFQEHVIVSPERGAYTICEMTDENAESAELVALSPELAAEVVRLHDELCEIADELEADAVRVGVSGTVATDETKIELAARIRQALEGAE